MSAATAPVSHKANSSLVTSNRRSNDFQRLHTMSSKPRFSLDIALGYIQSIRLVHALLEVGAEIYLGVDDQKKFDRLKQIFSVNPIFGSHNVPVLPHVVIDHTTPMTRIGRISRPLVFANAMLTYLRDRWPETRSHRITFAGLLTESRRIALNHWLADYNRGLAGLHRPSLFRRCMNKIDTRLDRDSAQLVKRGDVTLWSSNRGRHFPVKAWDIEYFNLLLDSQFVLCPNGDYVWSYRFLESIFCGAIPIVEDDCHLFDGFTYLHMSDAAIDHLDWSLQVAEANFALAIDRVVVPNRELFSEIQYLLHDTTAK